MVLRERRTLSSKNKSRVLLERGSDRLNPCVAPAAITSVAGRGERSSLLLLFSLELVGRRLAGATVSDDLEGDLLTFVEAVHSGALNGTDVHENVRAACCGLNKSKTLLGVEPLHGT